jgi:hypothetical protein
MLMYGLMSLSLDKILKLTVETSNTKSPYGTDNKESGGEVVAKFESTKLLQVCSIYNKESDTMLMYGDDSVFI